MIFSFFGSYNYVFQKVYHFNQKEIGLTFLGILVGFIFAVLTFAILDATVYRKAAAKANGQPAPEHRLYAAMIGSFMLPIGLFWFTWSPMKDVHWIVPVLAGVPFGWGCLSIFVSLLSLVTSPSPLPIQELTPSLDLSNDLPGRRLPSSERCLSCRGKWHPSIWLRCRFPALYSPNV